MFGMKFQPADGGCVIEAPEKDYKNAKRLGQFKISDKAIYKPTGEYVSFSAVKEVVYDMTSVHVSGCCAGGVPVERATLITEEGKYQFIFDTKKEIESLKTVLEGHV